MVKASIVERPSPSSLPLSVVTGILESIDRPLVVADADGRVCLANQRAQLGFESQGLSLAGGLNLFTDILKVAPQAVLEQLRGGEHEVDFPLTGTGTGTARARIHWLPESGWLAMTIESSPASSAAEDAAMHHTLDELIQEREITYRNLLAAYLRLQEVNRQKTVFLASAAHELKTPLAVMKGYYDLLLSGSLGKLTEKQEEIVSESKESCDRLVRLVSMFLNYSALESGKLVLHLRENDLRDCMSELAARWRDAFVRKKVRLEAQIDTALPLLKFDYQKVQQTMANLLDNALKHTPGGGHVTLSAEPHFWERRASTVSPSVERRCARAGDANSVLLSVADSGPGIAPEHHQEIFEDFVRVDRSSSGMGLGLAISKRLVQAHRGKIWVDSEVGRGCVVRFLLPTDLE